VAIVIQSRAPDDLIWRDEARRSNHFSAYKTAKAKARLTGRVYRLVDKEGEVLEHIREDQCSKQQRPDEPTAPKH
jgi:hypothetical protein